VGYLPGEIGPKDSITFGGDVVNYNLDERSVFSVTEFDYIKGKQPGFLDTSAQNLPANLCNGIMELATGFSPPKGQKKFSIQGKPMTVAKDGYIVAIRASSYLPVLLLPPKPVC
jgi:hypothetical protein